MALLKDKIIMITGAGKGIGRAGALLSAREGARSVFVVDSDQSAGEAVVEEIHALGGSATFVLADVTVEADMERAVAAAVADYGVLDCAWNNAGVNDAISRIADLSLERWDRMIQINLTAVFLSMKHQLRQMSTQGHGSIVNTASSGGLTGSPGLPHYSAAKHGVIGLTRTAALELRDAGIRVNAVCPGMVETPMVADWFTKSPEAAEAALRSQPGGRAAKPEEIAELALWLLSDRASRVSGLSAVVDGGMLAR